MAAIGGRRTAVAITCSRRWITVDTLNAVGPMVLLHQRMRDYKQHSISSDSFSLMAKECGVADAAEARLALQDAGFLVDFGDYVHLRPALLMEQTTGWSIAANAEKELSAIVSEEATLRGELETPLRKLRGWRRFVWACALVYCGFQGMAIAHLTFHEDGLGWDVMEPVSYFIGCYTSLFFFLYMLKYRREHSYVDFDKTIIAPRLRTKYAASFNWGKYDALCLRLKAKDQQLLAMKAWMRKN